MGSIAVCFGLLAFFFDYLAASGGKHMYLTLLPHAIKMFLAGVMEIVIIIAIVYFTIRFIIGFFVKEKEKLSPELIAINSLSESLNHKLDEIKTLLENKQVENKDNADKE